MGSKTRILEGVPLDTREELKGGGGSPKKGSVKENGKEKSYARIPTKGPIQIG